MSKEVRSIFVILIGTIVIMVLTSAIIEINNVNLNSIRLQHTIKLACEKSLELFSQESYKVRSSGGGLVNMPEVMTDKGSLYVTGKFYGESINSPEDIYKMLYASPNCEFKTWVNSPNIRNKWKSVEDVNNILNHESVFTQTTMPEYTVYLDSYGFMAADSAYEDAMDKYTEYLVAKSYKDRLITPINFGVPFIDKEVTTRIFRWNLATMLSDCDFKAVIEDGTEKYILKDGFRIYADQATIETEYRVYNTLSSADVKNFYNDTYINADDLGYLNNNIYLGSDDDERRNVCVVGVTYRIPISYEGITPLKSIFEYIWTRQVEGLGNSAPDYGTQTYSLAPATLEGGGFYSRADSSAGVLPVSNRLIFYLVR